MRDCEPVRKHLRGALEEGNRRQRLEIGGVAIEIAIIRRQGHRAPRGRNLLHHTVRRGLGERIPGSQRRKAKNWKPTKVAIIDTATPTATKSGRIAGVTAIPKRGARNTQAE